MFSHFALREGRRSIEMPLPEEDRRASTRKAAKEYSPVSVLLLQAKPENIEHVQSA